MLRYDGNAQYVPSFISISDIRSTAPGHAQFFSTTCTSGQTLVWESLTDAMKCANVAVDESQIAYSSQSPKTFFAAPTISSGSPTFRTIADEDLPLIDLTNGVTGVLPVEKGGTGATSLASKFILRGGQGGLLSWDQWMRMLSR